MQKGWFDLFRENGGPTLYSHANRTHVHGDASTIVLCIAFGTLYFAFFVVFPGIRKERFTTFLSVTLSLFVGTTILIANCASSWHVATAEVASAYKAFSVERIMGRVGVYIGLDHANITLDAMPIYYNESMDVHFNEEFRWESPMQLKKEFKEALVKGLPFPILTVVEYLAVDAEGFCWGRNYREAGYYTSIFLWSSFVLWVSMNIMILVVPRYGAYLMALTGLMMLFSDAVFWNLIPKRPLMIHIEDVMLKFEMGWCFWSVLIAGSLCFLVGTSISVIDLIYPHSFSTVLEMDYGTPFNRYIIIEDSHNTKNKKKNAPPEPAHAGFGGLFRKLSKRDKERAARQASDLSTASGHRGGHDNYAFEMEAPKSPWRYPHLNFRDSKKNRRGRFGPNHRQPDARGQDPRLAFMRRTDSKESNCSSLSSTTAGGMSTHGGGMGHDLALQNQSGGPHSLHDQMFQKRFRRTDSAESNNSSLASFFLSRNNSKTNQNHNMAVNNGGGHSVIERSASGGVCTVRVLGPAAEAEHPSSLEGRIPGTFPAEGASGSVMGAVGGGASRSRRGSGVANDNDEVAVIVSSGRKNSVTKAVRRTSMEHQHNRDFEAAMW